MSVYLVSLQGAYRALHRGAPRRCPHRQTRPGPGLQAAKQRPTRVTHPHLCAKILRRMRCAVYHGGAVTLVLIHAHLKTFHTVVYAFFPLTKLSQPAVSLP